MSVAEPGPSPAFRPDVADHALYLSLPFDHQHSVEALPPDWVSWWDRLDSDADLSRAQVLDDTWFFLPHVRRLLFPEAPEVLRLGGDPVDGTVKSAAALLDDQPDPDPSVGQVLRLTRAEAVGNDEPLLSLELDVSGPPSDWRGALDVDWIDVLLFPGGLGLLVLRARLSGDSVALEDLRRAVGALRVVHAPSLTSKLPRVVACAAGEARPHALARLLSGAGTVRALVDKLLADFVPRGQDLPSVHSETATGQVYGEAFRVLSYVRLSDVPPDPGALAFELALAEDTTDPVWAPAQCELDRLDSQATLHVWRGWQLLVTPEHSVFLATESSWFTEAVLAHNVEADYLPCLLLAQYQKLRLNQLAAQLATNTDARRRTMREAEAATEAFVLFRNHYWFAEVTNKTLGQRVFETFQAALGTTRMFDLVKEETEQVRAHLAQKAARRTASAVSVLTLVAGPVTIFLAYCGGLEVAPPTQVVAVGTVACLFLGLLASVVTGQLRELLNWE